MRQLVSGAKFQLQVRNNCEILQDATLRLNVGMKEELRNERGNERSTKICCWAQKNFLSIKKILSNPRSEDYFLLKSPRFQACINSAQASGLKMF